MRYISADFDFNYVDSESKISFGPTLLGAGFTNRPHIKEMQPIILSENEIEKLKIILTDHDNKNKSIIKENEMDFEQIMEVLKGLSPDEKAQALEMLKAEMPEIETQELEEDVENEDQNKMEKQLSDQAKTIADLNKKIATQEKEGKFNVMLGEGKVVESQRAHFLSGDMVKFIECAKVLHLEEDGNGGDNKTDETLDADKAELKLSEIAEKIEKEEGLDYGSAMSKAIDENPKLAEQVNK